MTPLPLLAFLLLSLHPHAAAAAAAGSPDPTPTPTPWPHQFHAALLMGHVDILVSLVNLWYDWPGGRILHEIRSPDTPSYDAEWNNGTSFFYTPALRACRSAQVGVGILRPDWLATGAAYLGRVPAEGYGGSDRHVWTKADFVTYYEDVATGHPVKWVFHTGHTSHVISFDPGHVRKDVEWQAPAYCFTDEGGRTDKDALVAELDMYGDPDMRGDATFIPNIRLLRGG
uniref:Uncharacterized protein n=1 Tax=Avena sativa TaxID=4498 RepID=A0ACD5TXK7_AVESA